MVFGLFALPDPWVPGRKAVEDAAAARSLLVAAIALAALLALHAAAALKHHFIDRDDVLARMTWGRDATDRRAPAGTRRRACRGRSGRPAAPGGPT